MTDFEGPTTPQKRLEYYLPMIRSVVSGRLSKRSHLARSWGVCALNSVEDVVQDVSIVILTRLQRYHSKGNDMSLEKVRPTGMMKLIKYAMRDTLEKNLPRGIYRDVLQNPDRRVPRVFTVFRDVAGNTIESQGEGAATSAANSESPGAAPEAPPLHAAEDPKVKMLLEDLPEKLSEVASLLMQHYTPTEVASKLSICTTTVHTRMNLIKKYLCSRIETQRDSA